MGNGNDIGLLEVIVRVLIIYLLLLASIRIMGKREIGQLSNLDFVVAIVIAELATLPLTAPPVMGTVALSLYLMKYAVTAAPLGMATA